jgi:hypothetical protein
MLIAAYFFIINVVVPQLAAYANALLEPVMTIIITLAGITMLFGAVGMRISNNLGSTIVGGIFRALGYIARTIINAIGWLIRNTFRIIPRVFNGSRRTFNQMGISPAISNVLAVSVVIIVLAIII